MGNGVSGSRMSYEGYSNTQPLFPEKTDKEKALDRRVEVYVLSNTDRQQPISIEAPNIDLRAPVLNIKFFPQKSRLYPSAHFMLTLIAEMMNQQEDIFYEFVIFDNINDSRLTKTRAASINTPAGPKG
ncbi:MAG: hypothetical protein U5L96_07410 [Owenweeksia sp.]|nr:hypothetical protein [Owenweeksia sp.]